MPQPVPQVDIRDLPDPLPSGVVVLDVREPVEWAAGHVPESVHIPLMELPGRLGELPADAPLLVVCKVGARSGQATAFLHAQGVDATNLANGLVAWEFVGRPLVDAAGESGHIR